MHRFKLKLICYLLLNLQALGTPSFGMVKSGIAPSIKPYGDFHSHESGPVVKVKKYLFLGALAFALTGIGVVSEMLPLNAAEAEPSEGTKIELDLSQLPGWTKIWVPGLLSTGLVGIAANAFISKRSDARHRFEKLEDERKEKALKFIMDYHDIYQNILLPVVKKFGETEAYSDMYMREIILIGEMIAACFSAKMDQLTGNSANQNRLANVLRLLKGSYDVIWPELKIENFIPEKTDLLKDYFKNWDENSPKILSPLRKLSLSKLVAIDVDLSDLGNMSDSKFNGANLSRSILSNNDLSRSQFIKATLKDCFLMQTVLMDAVMVSVNLENAKLEFANLKGADLRYANLKGANLSGADLDATVLFGADLTGAVITEKQLKSAILSKTTILPNGEFYKEDED